MTQKISYFDDRDADSKNSSKIHKSLLEEYLQNPNLDLADIVGMASDLLLAGVDTVRLKKKCARRVEFLY